MYDALAIVLGSLVPKLDNTERWDKELSLGEQERLAFGNTVTFNRSDGRREKYRIMGEDEADPKNGSISFVSPVAKSLVGKAVGDVVEPNHQELEIIAIA